MIEMNPDIERLFGVGVQVSVDSRAPQVHI